MIPKTIHYCWFGGHPLPEETQYYIDSWRKFCPDYEIIQWNESNFDVSQNPYCREAYEAQKWAFVSDYARLKVLYDHGGIYMDADVEVVKNLDVLLQYRAFSGFESDQHIPTGTMGAIRGNDWIQALLQDYDDRHFLRNDGTYDMTTNVVRITNLTQQRYGVRLDNTLQIFGNHMALFPFDWLCAKSYETGEILRTDNTLTIHHFAGSWLSDEAKKYAEAKKYWRKKYGAVYAFIGGRAIIKAIAAYQSGGFNCVIRKICGILKRRI